MSARKIIPAAEVVLIGAGHCHLEVIRAFSDLRARPYRLTLINESPRHYYRGNLGLALAGELSVDKAGLDLGHLCLRSGVRFIHDRVTACDLTSKKLKLATSTFVPSFDLLSLDLGAAVTLPEAFAANPRISTLKPTAALPSTLAKLWHPLLQNEGKKPPLELGVYGTDLRALELTLALGRRFATPPPSGGGVAISFFCPGDLLSLYRPHAGKCLIAALGKLRIGYKPNFQLAAYDEQSARLTATSGAQVACDHLLWALTGHQQPLVQQSSLQSSAEGRVRVHANLESASHPGIYVPRGSIDGYPKDSDESLAVTDDRTLGRILAANLTRRFTGLQQLRCSLAANRPKLIYLGQGRGLWLKMGRAWTGSWVARTKTKHDRQSLEGVEVKRSQDRASTYLESGNVSVRPCGGGAAKLPPDSIARLPSAMTPRPSDVVYGQEVGSDTSVISLGGLSEGTMLVQSLDYQMAFTKNLYNFGRLTAVHNTNHLFAVGQQGHSAQLTVTIPYATKEAMSRDLEELYAGVLTCLDACSITLVGGHYMAGPEASIAMLVQGMALPRSPLWPSNSCQLGDHLVLTKPLGSGILFAGHERYAVSSVDLHRAYTTLTLPHHGMREACHGFTIHGAAHVGGYGLAYHLAGLLADKSKLYARLTLGSLPVYAGVLAAIHEGVRSSLHTQNRLPYTQCMQGLSKENLTRAETFFDPQTAGPLLLCVAGQEAEALVASLRAAGYQESAVIGRIGEIEEAQTLPFTLVP